MAPQFLVALMSPGLQALWFFKWQGPASLVPYAVLNLGVWPGGTGFLKSSWGLVLSHSGSVSVQGWVRRRVLTGSWRMIKNLQSYFVYDWVQCNTLGRKKKNTTQIEDSNYCQFIWIKEDHLSVLTYEMTGCQWTKS